MKEFLFELLQAVATAAVPVCAAFLVQFLRRKSAEAAARTDSLTTKELLAEVTEAVTTAVTYTSQTYVDTLKKDGIFNKEAQMEALQKAKDKALALLSESSKDVLARYVKAKAEYLEKDSAYTKWFNSESRNDPDRQRKVQEFRAYKEQFKTTWAFLTPYITRQANAETHRYEEVFMADKLDKDLDTEANRKYDFIIQRTNAIVGEITDASGLSVGAKGDLNGYIIGKKGRAKVQTIGAGGYNIQCFHFRTLINAA